MAVIRFYNKRFYSNPIQVNVENDLKNENYGGQARIYSWKFRNKKFIVKAIPDDSEIFRRMRDIYYALSDRKRRKIPHSIFLRGIPVAQGLGTPEEFKFRTAKSVYLLVFRYTYGEILSEYFKKRKEPPLSDVRKNIAKKLLDILIYMQDRNVIHGDLYPDNFLVDRNGQVFIMDFEGAGVMNSNRRFWIWKPTVLGKDYIFPNPPEVKRTGVPSFFSDRWIGVFLIFWTLVGIHPLPFLIRIDNKALEDLYNNTDKNKHQWPPVIKSTCKYIQKEYPIEKFRTFMEHYFGDTNFGRILFLTYIIGFKEPSKRPSFREVKVSLKGVIE
ncbi:MAG: protein kinase [Candidatus Asgardarchaeum sp.]